jgi:tRNA pseudouridine55 synthase
MPLTSSPSGFILVNKPVGITSHDVINALRRLTGQKKIGHSGTLDPLASGLLICAVGREATREIDKLAHLTKCYRAELILGAVSDTYDSQGLIVKQDHPVNITKSELLEALNGFKGEQWQVPPMYSAKKVQGQKLYELARRGIEIERQACQITISRLELLEYQWPQATIDVACSSGTYIRSLIHDLGHALSVGAYMSTLERTAIGPYTLAQAQRLSDLSPDNWIEHLITLNLN